MLHIYTDKTVTTLKSNDVIAHPVHLVFLNMSNENQCKIIDNGLSVLGVVPVQLDNTSDAVISSDPGIASDEECDVPCIESRLHARVLYGTLWSLHRTADAVRKG